MSMKDLLNFIQNKKEKDTPIVTIKNSVNVSEYPWCNSAVFFTVKNGKGTLTHRFGVRDKDYCNHKSQMMLNGFPIVQYDTPYCPTCTGMIATGYGIENIDCAELDEIRNGINSDFIDIITSAEILKPFLGLLDDGIYLLADVPHYPTNGAGKIFYDIPNKLTKYDAYCDSYYNNDFLTVIDSFPAYIYPTQSDECINDERVAYYIDLFKKNKNPPRAIAYHDKGFISVLLDGHHKAVAAAHIGTVLNCLTIIRGYLYKCSDEHGNIKEYIGFSTIRVPSNETESISRSTKSEEDLHIKEYNLIHHSRSFNVSTEAYLTVRELTDIYAANLENAEITDELLDELLAEKSDENIIKLKYVLAYLMRTDKTKAFALAKKIIDQNTCELPIKEAYRVLLNDKNEQTEKLFIDYIVCHSPDDVCWDIVNSYWD